MNKIVVFGANGFIGRNLVTRLAATGKDTIVAFDRFSAYQNGLAHPFKDHVNVQVIAGNFFNREEVSEALTGANYVFHLVSSTNPATSNNDPLVDVDTNIRMSIELFQLCVEKGVKKIIFPSSGGTVYGDIDSNTINEATLPLPRSPYGIGKLTIEHYLRYFNFTSGLEYVVYRIANPYGPGQNIYGKQGVVPIFMQRLTNEESITIFGDGTMIRDYIYIDDLLDMIIGSYLVDNKHPVYNLGSGAGSSVNQIIESIEACTGKSADKTYAETPQTYVHKSVLNIDRFINEFGIKPAIGLEEGIARTWDYVNKLS